jgi:TPR repeat protein
MAIRIFTQLAERGNASAAFQLGETYGDPRSPVADEATASRWYRKSAELGSDEGQLHMSRRLIQGLTAQLAFHTATRWLNSREGLPPTDQPYPNHFLDPRHGLASAAADRQAAEQWLTAVARSNSEHRNRALVALADFLLRRDLHPTDRFPEAWKALQQAATDKDALAQAMLAELYAEGRPPQLTADPAKAAELRELCLAAARPEARNYVLQSEQDRARRAAGAAKVAPDYIKAMLLAAQRGHPQALTELGLHHLHFDQVEGTPLPLDLAKAAQNLTPGALAGDSLALMGLGLTYQKTKDLPNRFKLHLKAANNGDQPLAQLWAGAACEQGLGTAVDLVEADKWYQLAAKQKQEGSAEGRRRIEAQMSAEQLIEARRRADAYQPLKAPVAESAPAVLPK